MFQKLVQRKETTANLDAFLTSQKNRHPKRPVGWPPWPHSTKYKFLFHRLLHPDATAAAAAHKGTHARQVELLHNGALADSWAVRLLPKKNRHF